MAAAMGVWPIANKAGAPPRIAIAIPSVDVSAVGLESKKTLSQSECKALTSPISKCPTLERLATSIKDGCQHGRPVFARCGVGFSAWLAVPSMS
jgi:hypothetical protein